MKIIHYKHLIQLLFIIYIVYWPLIIYDFVIHVEQVFYTSPPNVTVMFPHIGIHGLYTWLVYKISVSPFSCSQFMWLSTAAPISSSLPSVVVAVIVGRVNIVSSYLFNHDGDDCRVCILVWFACDVTPIVLFKIKNQMNSV